MTTVASITARDWSPKLNSYGDVVTSVQDIAQCLRIAWLTPYGSCPIRRTFGSTIHRYLDKPLPIAKAAVPLSVIQASAWEPRAEIEDVTVTLAGLGAMEILVQWHPIDAPTQTQTTAITAEEVTAQASEASVIGAVIDKVIAAMPDTSDFMRKSEYASTQQGVVRAAEKLSGTAPDGTHYTAELGEQGRIIAEDNE